MLKDSFYKVLSVANDSNSCKAAIVFNKTHDIFQGHFPELPIVPGVCILQILKELLVDNLDKKVNLVKAGNIKFLGMINPMENDTVNFEINFMETEAGIYAVESLVLNERTTFFKMQKGIYSL